LWLDRLEFVETEAGAESNADEWFLDEVYR
jgi:hypothetical protein